jgi:hypothetical protein
MQNKLMTIAAGVLLAAFATVGNAVAFQDKTTKATTAAKTTKAAAVKPTAAEIADAKAKGLVWVNTNTKVYHKDGEYYGNTAKGKFMTAADADKAGFKAAKEPGSKSTKSTAKATTK